MKKFFVFVATAVVAVVSTVSISLPAHAKSKWHWVQAQDQTSVSGENVEVLCRVTKKNKIRFGGVRATPDVFLVNTGPRPGPHSAGETPINPGDAGYADKNNGPSYGAYPPVLATFKSKGFEAASVGPFAGNTYHFKKRLCK